MIKLTLVIALVTSLLAVIIATPAMAQDKSATGTPWGTVILPMERIVVKPCKVRKLDQGAGSVRICEGAR